MPRDKEIKKIFEIADDGMQSVIGYFYYGIACKKVASVQTVLPQLPQNGIRITHDWGRYYNSQDPQELIRVMTKYFEPYHARICLISIISIFEGALKNFIERLLGPQKTNSTYRSYKSKLEWVFKMTLKSTYGTKKMLARIPNLCLDVDHARRIRNLWMHNNGLFDSEYEKGITVDGHSPIIDPSYQKYARARKNKIQFRLKLEDFDNMVRSHIELLHQLNDCIQKKYFGQKRSYSYKALKKPIEWQRLFNHT